MTPKMTKFVEKRMADFEKRLAVLEDGHADVVIKKQQQLSAMRKLHMTAGLVVQAFEKKTGRSL